MTSTNWLYIKLGFLCLFLCGMLFPASWWGTHSIAFLSPFPQYTLFIAAAVILIGSHFKPLHLDTFSKFDFLDKNMFRSVIIPLLAVVMGILFYQFPIYLDVYGDAVRIMKAFGNRIEQVPPVFLEHLFSFDIFHPRNGERTVLGSALVLANKSGLTLTEVFRILGAICGAAYIFLWLRFATAATREPQLRLILFMTGLTAPFLLLFMGHVEIYAPSVVAITAFLLVICNYFRTGEKVYLWLMPPILYFCLKFHSSAFLLVPAFLLVVVFEKYHQKDWLQSRLNWKGLTLWVLLPIFAAGAFVYFFVHGDYNDPRYFFSNFTIYDRMFLPILSPEPPYDRYNLLGFNHIFDYFNIMLLWSPAALYLLIVIFTLRKKIDWNAPFVLIAGMTLILYSALLFMVNPLLGMQFDWDLFSLPAPILLIFVGALLAQIQTADIIKRLTGPVLALSILTIPIFLTNVNKKSLSYRLESLGVRTFETYWIRSAEGISFGIELLRDDKALYLKRWLEVAKRLEKFALPGNDVEYADILVQVGKFYLRETTEFQKALHYFQQAQKYAPNQPLSMALLIESHFRLKQFEQAFQESLRLIQYDSNKNKAYRISIHCALEAEKYKEAEILCEKYLAFWPEDNLVKTVFKELRTGTHLQQIKRHFANIPSAPAER